MHQLNCILILCLICFFQQIHSYPDSQCTPDVAGEIVPADVCDHKFCQSVTAEDLQNVVPVNIYSFDTKLNKVITFCPTTFNYTTTIDPYDPTVAYILSVTTGTCGEKCDQTYTTTKKFEAKIDQYSGNLMGMQAQEDGVNYDSCYPLFIRGGPVIYRTCKQDPTLYPGQAYASLTLQLPVDGDCKKNRDILTEFFKTYPLDWSYIIPGCPY